MCFHRRKARRGLSLAELMVSTLVLTMIAGALGALAMSVQTTATYNEDYGTAARHGRVVIDRIDRTIRQATVSERFPGVLVLPTLGGNYYFPDILVVWKPTGAAVDSSSTGVPRANELVIYRARTGVQNQLVEITNPSESATVTYPASDTTNWTTLVNTLSARNNAQVNVLTDLLRTAKPSASSSAKGAVRFKYTASPTDGEITNYRAGTTAWTDMTWPLDIRGSTVGLRSICCAYEIQLAPRGSAADTGMMTPLFWSTTINKEVKR